MLQIKNKLINSHLPMDKGANTCIEFTNLICKHHNKSCLWVYKYYDIWSLLTIIFLWDQITISLSHCLGCYDHS